MNQFYVRFVQPVLYRSKIRACMAKCSDFGAVVLPNWSCCCCFFSSEQRHFLSPLPNGRNECHARCDAMRCTVFTSHVQIFACFSLNKYTKTNCRLPSIIKRYFMTDKTTYPTIEQPFNYFDLIWHCLDFMLYRIDEPQTTYALYTQRRIILASLLTLSSLFKFVTLP